jgi:hypothetical protein
LLLVVALVVDTLRVAARVVRVELHISYLPGLLPRLGVTEVKETAVILSVTAVQVAASLPALVFPAVKVVLVNSAGVLIGRVMAAARRVTRVTAALGNRTVTPLVIREAGAA